MSTFLSPVRGKSWLFQVTALCIVLGMLLALSLKTQRQAVSEGIPARWPALRVEFLNLKRENVNLQRDLAEYKSRYEKLAREQAAGISSTKGIQQALDEAQMLAGTVAMRGAGIVVTLNDSPKRDPSETRKDVVEQYMVHDSDIRDIVNELFSAGAEAISINNQRLVANSSIRCAGAVVLVNSVQIAPPYIIKAIGKSEVLEKALELPMGVADGLFLLDMIQIKRETDISVPAFTGSTRFNIAHKK